MNTKLDKKEYLKIPEYNLAARIWYTKMCYILVEGIIKNPKSRTAFQNRVRATDLLL